MEINCGRVHCAVFYLFRGILFSVPEKEVWAISELEVSAGLFSYGEECFPDNRLEPFDVRCMRADI